MSSIKKDTSDWEVIIVGAGPAGSAAAMVLARMRRRVLIIDDGRPRNKLSHGMHNYLSRDGELPMDFLKKAHEELDRYHVAHIASRAVKAERLDNGSFEITDSNDAIYRCRRLLIATGVTDNIPDVAGMKERWGDGVYHCPYCDGFELCDKVIGLYAKRFNGFGMALSLKHLTKDLILLTDGSGHLKRSQIAQLEAKGIKVITKKLKELTCADDKLTCITFNDDTSVPCNAVFVHHGHTVNNDLLVQLGARVSRNGEAITNRKQQCSIPNLFVAGDAAIDMHFVAVAAAEGTKAGVAIHDSFMQEENATLAASVLQGAVSQNGLAGISQG